MTVWRVRDGAVPYGCWHFPCVVTCNPNTPHVSITVIHKIVHRDNAWLKLWYAKRFNEWKVMPNKRQWTSEIGFRVCRLLASTV